MMYYILKPYVPWRIRMGMRRLLAQSKRARYQKVWPINESAARRPTNWPGWPEGKRFAVVLTHDVEGAAGYAKCLRLAEIEMELGFRSSFNFVPEGEYTVTPERRTWLTERGFEIGVHDLRHDGKLFLTRQGFEHAAERINGYLQAWQARGFRAAFMLRKPEWMHRLDIRPKH